MPRFDVLEPQTLPEAVGLLRQHGATARPLAGGTDLMVAINLRHLQPRYLVNLKHIPGLEGIELEQDGLRIGSLTKVADLAESTLIRERYSLLAQAAGELGSVQVRNLATVGGNLCNASPSADTAPALIALDSQAHIVGPAGERVVPLEGFFTGPGTTVLGEGELLTHLWLPLPSPRAGGCYLKSSTRKTMDCAVVGIGVLLEADEARSICVRARIVLGATAPTPIRAREAEAFLLDRPFTAVDLDQVGQAAASAATPIDDVRGSAGYRREMVRVLAPRAIRQAWLAAQANPTGTRPPATLGEKP